MATWQTKISPMRPAAAVVVTTAAGTATVPANIFAVELSAATSSTVVFSEGGSVVVIGAQRPMRYGVRPGEVLTTSAATNVVFLTH